MAEYDAGSFEFVSPSGIASIECATIAATSFEIMSPFGMTELQKRTIVAGVFSDPAPIPPDTTDPVLAIVSPAQGTTVAKSTPFVLDVTDNSGAFRRVILIAVYASGIHEVVHDGDSFVGHYALTSSRQFVVNGWRYTVLRRDGWPNGPKFRAYAIDQSGNEGKVGAWPSEPTFEVE